MSGTERPSTLDQFGGRLRVIPGEVTGPLRDWRNRTNAVLLIIFLALPWVRINGLQAILLDIPGRRFEIFGTLFLAHDAPLVFFLMMLAVFSLVLVTALWGRVWCGWACPQTVFIDGVYRKIEIWIEGNYIERRRLHARGLDAEKFFKLSAKWFAYFVVSSLFAHSFIAYFLDSRRLLEMMQGPPGDNWSYFLIVSCVTGFLMFNFGWFREQFCLIMCPYGRFQSVLMDQHTVAVMYDEKRSSDCIDCGRCVQVCPTGIDIRKGIQMECISCTACIDACNVIMKKVKKPEGLIRHKRISDGPPNWFRPRITACLIFIAVLTGALIFSLKGRESYSAVILRAKDTPFQIMTDGMVLNHFKAHLVNQSHESKLLKIELPEEELVRGVKIIKGQVDGEIAPGASTTTHFFLSFPRALLNERGEVSLKVLLKEGEAIEKIMELTGVGPAHSSGTSSANPPIDR